MSAQLEILRKQHDEIGREIVRLEREEREAKYAANVANLGITLDQVELSNGDVKPWFGMVTQYLDWCKQNSTKPYREWNTLVFIGERYTDPICDLYSLKKGKPKKKRTRS